MFCYVDIDFESLDGFDIEDVDDIIFIIFWEDMSKFDFNFLLYKVVQVRNFSVMLEVLVNKVDLNWVNQDDKGMTFLMKVVDIVSWLNKVKFVFEC